MFALSEYYNFLLMCVWIKKYVYENFSSLLLFLMKNYQMLYFTSIYALKYFFSDLEYFFINT